MGLLIAVNARVLIAVLVAAALAGCSTLQLDRRDVAAPVWTTEGATPLRANAVPQRVPPPLDVKWDFNAGAGFGSVSPLIVGDVVFAATRKGEVHAIDIESGDRVGQESFGESIEGTPVYANGTLVVPLAWGGTALHAHDLLRGVTRWRARGAPVSSGLVVHGGKVIAGDVEGRVRAFSLDDGEEVWTTVLEERSGVYSTPVLLDDRIIIANDLGRVAALDASDGSVIWSASAGAPVQVALAADERTVYAATTRGHLRALDVDTGATRWEYALSAAQVDHKQVYLTAAAVGEWEVVFGASDGVVRSVDIEDGSLRWSADVSDAVSAAPILTDHVVYVGTMGSQLIALSRENGSRTWETEVEGRIKSAFAVKGSRLVVMAEPRVVYLFEPSPDAYATREK